MSNSSDVEAAKQLAAQLLELCDRMGNRLAGNHIQYGIDRLTERTAGNRLREDRQPWGDLNDVQASQGDSRIASDD